MKITIKKIIIATAILLVLGAVAYWAFSGKKSVYIEVETVPVKTGEVITTVTATGTVQPIKQVSVGTQVSGVIDKIYVDYNSIVKKGQLIAELDKTNLRAALKQSQASYDNALNEVTYQKSIYDRQKQLYDKSLITQEDYDLALYNYNNAKGNVIQRKSDLDKAKTNLSYAYIYSPISGVVLSRDVDEGQTVAASLNTPTLFSIAQDLKQMQVEADVDEADIGGVTEGQRVSFTVDSFQDEEFSGTVTQVRLNPTTTSNVVTYTVVVKADNPELKLKPGMTATIEIYTHELKGIATLEAKAVNNKLDEALLTKYYLQTGQTPDSVAKSNDQSGTFVYVKQKDALIVKKIKLGIDDGINVQVLEGLEIDDQVVYNLKEITGEKVDEASQSPFMPKMTRKNKS